MMKKKMTSFLLVLTLLLGLSLTACGGDADSADSADDSTSSAEADPNEGLGGDDSELDEEDYTVFKGIWLSNGDDQYDSIDIDADGNWNLLSCGEVLDMGYLWYRQEEDLTRFISHQNDELDGYAEVDGDQLSISSLGDFSYLGRSVSEFQGVWYLDGDLSAETYIVIDPWGDWEYYQRVPGDAEGVEIDSGSLAYDLDEGGCYYANSLYDDTSYQVFEFDFGVLIWGDEGVYHWMEEWSF